MSTRFNRQSFLGVNSDKVLNDLCVAIVGLGGGGSHVAQQLAHLGVGHFVLFDPDRIEESNLNRLIGGTDDDVRQNEWKVQISSRTILLVNPDADVTGVKAYWQERGEFLRDCDVIVGCVDTFSGRNELERTARRYLIPYVDIGLDVHQITNEYFISGQVVLSMPGEACLHCMNVVRGDLLAEEAARYGAAGGRPQVVWANGVLASMVVGMIVQLATPWHPKQPPACLLEYEGNLNEVRVSDSVNFLRGRPCPHFLAVSDVGDPWYERNPILKEPT
jgi:hypothetical protein